MLARRQRRHPLTQPKLSFTFMRPFADGVGAGVHEKVLIVLEGRAASDAIGQKGAPVDAAIVGIVDTVDLG